MQHHQAPRCRRLRMQRCPSDTIADLRQFLRQANHSLWLRSHECTVDVQTLQKALPAKVKAGMYCPPPGPCRQNPSDPSSLEHALPKKEKKSSVVEL